MGVAHPTTIFKKDYDWMDYEYNDFLGISRNWLINVFRKSVSPHSFWVNYALSGLYGCSGDIYYTQLYKYHYSQCLMNVPFLCSAKEISNSSLVFIIIGPPQATGSPSGLPATNRKRTGDSLASTLTACPVCSNSSTVSGTRQGWRYGSHPASGMGRT